MRKFIAFLALLLVLLTSAAHLFAQDRPNLIELLQNDADGRFTTLLAAIDAAGLTDALSSGAGPYTLLAPTNDAFAAALETMGMTADEALADTTTLTQILRYHVIPGYYPYRNLTGGATLGTALAGQRVTFTLDGGSLIVQGAVVSDADNLASNGVMHAVDSVMLPPAVQEALAATPEPTPEPTAEPTPEATPVVGVAPERPNLVEVLQNDVDGRFTTLLAILDATGLSSPLSTRGPFTLLAPTNDAFTATLDALGMTLDDLLANSVAVNQVMLYHILPGSSLYRTLTGGATLPTRLLGESVTFTLDGGSLIVQGAVVSDADNLASNGVMHAVDSVMLPPAVQAALATPEPTAAPTEEPTAVPTAEPTAAPTPEPTPVVGVAPERPNLVEVLQNDVDGRFTTLLAILDATGLSSPLSTRGPFTLLAPTNDAFAALLDSTGMTLDDLLANSVAVNQIMLYHILPGSSLYRTLTGGATLPTRLLGESVTFALDGGSLMANGAVVSDPDNLASNGVMHTLDSVMLPPAVQAAMATPEPTPEPTTAPTAVPTPEATAVVGVAPERPNLVELLQNDADGRFTTLLAVIDAAGQTATLSTGGPFTLLAPTNDAFTALLDQVGMTVDQALANPTVITPVLLYHVIPGRYPYRILTGGATLNTLLSDETVTVALDGGSLMANGAVISDADNLASNGVMHALDSVMLPPAVQAALATPEPTAAPTEEPTAVPTAEPTAAPTPEPTPVVGVAPERPNLVELLQNDADGRFTTLLAILDATGLSSPLSTRGPFTLLAPTNDAFTATLDALDMTLDDLLANSVAINQIMLYHILPGSSLYRTLTGGATLPTRLLGESVTFALDGGSLTANGAALSDADNLASNGVMHALDSVMLPPAVQATIVSNPRMRVAHFSPDAGSVDIYVNGTLSSMTGLAFPDVSAWVNVSPGTYEIGIAPAGGDPIVTVSVDAAQNQWLTVSIVGSQAEGTLRGNVVAEDFSPLAEGEARLSMYNTVEGSPAYNVRVDGNTVVIQLGYPGAFGSNDGYFSADVPAGTYLIEFVVTTSTSTVVISLPDTTLEAGTSYLLAAAGSPGAPGAVTVPSAVPAP